MKEVLRLVRRVSPSDTSVLITGESGTGKELVAQAIHRLSPRSDKPFIDLNCAALQDTLLESELFGHEAGAFSGARSRKLGLFELADGGTLFLDEIMEMPPQLQSKLLRALETRSFFRVGGVKKVEVDVRLLSATNRDPKQAVGEGAFRADLMYRINSFEVNIPPLRERREDVIPLARHILAKIGGANPPELTPPVIEALGAYTWTGNVRQLRNCLERAALLADNGRVTCSRAPAGGRLPFREIELVRKLHCTGQRQRRIISQCHADKSTRRRTSADPQRTRENWLASRKDRRASRNFTIHALSSAPRVRPRISCLMKRIV
jgi:transcriptional regulator with PAS, ATPase and Fis domain